MPMCLPISSCGEAELIDQPLQAVGPFDRAQVGALQVLSQCSQQRDAVRALANHAGHVQELEEARDAQAALGEDNFKLHATRLSDDDWLNDSQCWDGARELSEGGVRVG